MIHPFSPAAPGQPSTAAIRATGPGLAHALAERLVSSVGLTLGGSTLALYALTFLVVHRHYQEYLPHYDSIGMYGSLFQLTNRVARDGLLAALPGAFQSGMSWLLPAFGLALAWAPVRAPEWLVSLNFLLLLATQAAIVCYGRTSGFSRPRQIAAGLMPLVPGALYAWDGGIEDLRRDTQLILLATAILFLSLAHVSRPTWRRGLALGLLVGLAQWSRDNAAAVILIVSLPAMVWAIVRARRVGGIVGLLRLAIIPVAVFLLLALPYYDLTLALTVERFRTIVWGVGEDRVESLLAFWWIPGSVLLGGDSRLSGRVRTALVTAGLLLGASAAVWLFRRSGVLSVRADRLREPGSALLLAGGAWVIVAVVLYNTLLLGYGARWHGVPFLPTYVGLVAVLAGLLGAVQPKPGVNTHQLTQIAAVGYLLLMASVPLRMLLNQPPALGEAGVDAVRAAAFEIADRAAGRPVALIAFDTLSRYHADYYLTQVGRPPLTEFEPIANAHGDPIDLDQPIRPEDRPEVLRARLDTALRRWADFALVYTDTARYADQREPLWPYQLGQPVIDALLADPGWRPVARFTLRERDMVLLENTSR